MCELSECTAMVRESEIELVSVCDRSVFCALELLAVWSVKCVRRGASRPLLSFFHVVLWTCTCSGDARMPCLCIDSTTRRCELACHGVRPECTVQSGTWSRAVGPV